MLVEHHIKYKEIHGCDETVWVDAGEHRSLHMRLRKENACKISSKTLQVISHNAYVRTEKGRRAVKKYRNDNVFRFRFHEQMMRGVRLIERIDYNKKTGSVCVSCIFAPSNEGDLFYIGDEIKKAYQKWTAMGLRCEY